MTFTESIRTCFKKYAEFNMVPICSASNGRLRRWGAVWSADSTAKPSCTRQNSCPICRADM